MDLVLDKDIRSLSDLNKFSLYLFQKTRSSLDQVFLVIEERKEGFLIDRQEDLNYLVSYCESIHNFYPRIIVQDEIIDFRVLEEGGNALGSKVHVGQEFVKDWKIRCCESASIFKIDCGKWNDFFFIEEIDEHVFLVSFKFRVVKKDDEVEFVARAVDGISKCVFGPGLWVYFRT